PTRWPRASTRAARSSEGRSVVILGAFVLVVVAGIVVLAVLVARSRRCGDRRGVRGPNSRPDGRAGRGRCRVVDEEGDRWSGSGAHRAELTDLAIAAGADDPGVQGHAGGAGEQRER